MHLPVCQPSQSSFCSVFVAHPMEACRFVNILCHPAGHLYDHIGVQSNLHQDDVLFLDHGCISLYCTVTSIVFEFRFHFEPKVTFWRRLYYHCVVFRSSFLNALLNQFKPFLVCLCRCTVRFCIFMYFWLPPPF